MNLMFKKNFAEQKTPRGKAIGGKTSVGRHTAKRSSREQGYTPIEEHHYRTHLFFSPPRCSYSTEDVEGKGSSSRRIGTGGGGGSGYLHHKVKKKENMVIRIAVLPASEPRCGPMTGTGSDLIAMQSTTSSPPMTESDLPQPLVIRNPSDTLLKWPTTPTRLTPNRQDYGSQMSELQRNLKDLDRDCFIIPVHSLDRFLPAGVPMPKPSTPSTGGTITKKAQDGLHVMEVPDPKLCILCHLMSPLEPIDPVLESPLTQPLFKQRAAAGELVTEVAQAKTAVTGMLLANMEKNCEFPFITYYVINSSQTNPVMFYNNLRTASLSKFDPRATRYSAAHTLDLYAEVASICRPPIYEAGTSFTRSHTPGTGYMISVYKVFEGDDREKFERNWLYWTGARMIYRYLPPHAGLKRISLHKSLSPKGDKMYILVCECANLLNDVTVSAILLPALRARLTGYTGLFRPIQTF